MASDTSRSRSRDTVHDERLWNVALLNRFNVINDDNVIYQNYADHLHEYFGTDPSVSESGFDDTDISDLESNCPETQTPRQCLLSGY